MRPAPPPVQQDVPWDQQLATLFIHIPKSGGTTLDAIFRDHYFATPLIPITSFEGIGHHFSLIDDPSVKYVGGHYPISTVDSQRFQRRMTVLRDPVESICSGLSYMNRQNGLPQDALTDIEKSGRKALTYKKFFTTHFDKARYLIDLEYGIAAGMGKYLFECPAEAAFENMKDFTHVFDFADFEGELKRFIIEENFFPYTSLPRKRQYSYVPDHDRARPLLSEFDIEFHALCRQLLRPVATNIDTQYEVYRERYCRDYGLNLEPYQGTKLDLRKPIGTGWHPAEVHNQTSVFRWSEARSATIDLPISKAGHYDVHFYVKPEQVERISVSLRTLIHCADFPVRVREFSGLYVYCASITCGAHDWAHLEISMESNSLLSPEDEDVRERGVILGNVYICRLPNLTMDDGLP